MPKPSRVFARLARTALGAIALALAVPATALADLSITGGPSGVTRDSSVTIRGAGAIPAIPVTVAFARDGGGSAAASATPGADGGWSASASLPEGSWSAQATQPLNGPSGVIGFRIDRTAPELRLTGPSGSTARRPQLITGVAGGAPGDGNLRVVLRSGFGGSGRQLDSWNLPWHGSWSAATSNGPGRYSVRASQSDDAGNESTAGWLDFTVVGAGFSVSNERPTAGTSVSFSASTPDGVRSFQWDLDGDGRYEASGRTASTAYPSAGTRTARLQVTASDGSTASSTRTIAVAAAPVATGQPAPSFELPAEPNPTQPAAGPPLLNPWPTIRIAGKLTKRGARIRVLSIRTPKGVVVRARCKGSSCPEKKVRRQRVRRRARTVRFRQLEKSFRSGTMIDIRVFAPDRIGKFTRFRIRKGQSPLRYDTCVQPGGKRIMQCPGT